MKTQFLLPLIFSSILFLPLSEIQAETSLISRPKEPQIAVNNRILAKANGKAISVVDLMKKMDMLFYKQFPEYTSSTAARHQYYEANWKYVLKEMIDKELIMADAEESKLVVSAGDVRQEMESLFGPNIIDNLDQIGLNFEEAYQMVLADITIRRMMYFRVQSKAMSQATPQKIREYYDQIAKNTIRDNEWIYRVMTIRHSDPVKATNIANEIQKLLNEGKVPFIDIPEKLKELSPEATKQPRLTLSEEFQTKEKDLSDPIKEILITLSPESYSLPISQKSRADNSTVVRIFYLKNKIPGGAIPFNELEAKIKAKLIDEAVDKESKAYMTKLRQHFDTQEALTEDLTSPDYHPFQLK